MNASLNNTVAFLKSIAIILPNPSAHLPLGEVTLSLTTTPILKSNESTKIYDNAFSII
jgi:hypothetical protein